MSTTTLGFHNVVSVKSEVDHFGPDKPCKSEHVFSRMCITATDETGQTVEINLFFVNGNEPKIQGGAA